MLSVSSPQSPRLPPAAAVDSAPAAAAAAGDDDDDGETAQHATDMDKLLTKLRRNMVELILQGDDVTRQMWQMYSVFEEIFGLQRISSKPPPKPIVVGDRLKQRATASASLSPAGAASSAGKEGNENTMAVSSTSPTSTTNGATIATATITTSATGTATTATTMVPASPSVGAVTSTAIMSSSSPTVITSSPTASSSDSMQRHSAPAPQTDKGPFIRSKVNQRISCPEDTLPAQMHEPRKVSPQSIATSPPVPFPSSSNSGPSPAIPSRTSNPLLDTIGALAGSNPDSDDSDLDIVYQQLRYRGRHRRPEQVRMRTQRSHRHHLQQFASSDPESTSYAGSNSIDSGYKSQCATPEVSDSLSAPEVRRSAEDVSASDSSTTSGRPRSSDGSDPKTTKIKMGTRSIAGKVTGAQTSRSSRYQQPPLLESSMNDVTLDHLMYLRQSLRKDRQDYPSSSHSSIPSSSASSTVRDESSPSAITDEEGGPFDNSRMVHHGMPQRQSPLLQAQQQPSYMPPVPYPRMDSPSFIHAGPPRKSYGSRGERRLSAGDEIEGHAAGESGPPNDYLLSGVEFYDLDSVHDFPQRRGYVAMLEEKTRCSRIHVMAAPKRDNHPGERRPDPPFKSRKDPSRTPPVDPSVYGYHRRSSLDVPPTQSHRPHNPRGADSKLTEAAIRVLEMIEDFRMEEAIENASSYNKMDARGRVRSNVSVTTVGPHAFVPRFRRHSGSRSGMRPASTGSLMSSGVPLDARSVASAASSYAASAEQHVYEEIMYDLVCERPEQALQAPMLHNAGTKPRNRILPVRPMPGNASHGYLPNPDLSRMTVRSQKHRSNVYSLVAEHDSRSSERFLEMDWNTPRGRRDNLPPDFPA